MGIHGTILIVALLHVAIPKTVTGANIMRSLHLERLLRTKLYFYDYTNQFEFEHECLA